MKISVISSIRLRIMGYIFPLVTIVCSCSTPEYHNSDPEYRFLNPAMEVKPYVWWHWMGPNFSKEGITKDLEAMKEAGIGGATIFNITSAVQESHAPTLNNPWPEQTYRSPAYWEAMRFAASEAQRLGLEIGLHNTVGYSTTGGPWIDEPRSMQHLVWSDTVVTGALSGAIRLQEPELIANEGWGKTGRILSYYKDIAVFAVPAGKKAISLDEVIDLTDRFDTLKGLKWDAPPGSWKVFRIGHASTGRPPHPVPDDVIGETLEADKMSVKQNRYHWGNVIEPVKEHLGEYVGISFRHMLIDSYEAGYQNWTSGFRTEFIKRKGYDPLPWVVSFGQPIDHSEGEKTERQRILESEEHTRRFEWDYMDVINQLYFENGWEVGKAMLHDANLKLQFEPYGGPFNTAQGVALADLPMGEFWTHIPWYNSVIPAAARAAGKTTVGAEAFTGWPDRSRYTEDPAFLKRTADISFASGVNRLILHHWVHQPFDDKYQPGMSMGWWGTHFGRHQTWFDPGKAFFSYLGRCQALLQYGEEVADYLSVGELNGFSDLISTDDFLENKIAVKNGKVVLPSGRSYPFMVFSDTTVMLPEVAKKIRSLVGEGATIVSPKPECSPSLQNYPECDITVKEIADEVWGDGTHNRYKKGYVFTRLEDAIEKFAITPDYRVVDAPVPEEIKITHRHSPEADIYFVANTSHNPRHISISFRISGKQPELWQAEDGSITNAPVWEEKEGRTMVNLSLNGIQSVFVVFRKPSSNLDHPVAIAVNDSTAEWKVRINNDDQPVLFATTQLSATVTYASGKSRRVDIDPEPPTKLTGAWEVNFMPPTDDSFKMEFPKLVDFSEHDDNRVNYFSGTATYSKKIHIDASVLQDNQRIILDLGTLNDIAEVQVNGQHLGVLWYPPYRIDITNALKEGDNKLEIDVTNNWANRLIGDEQEPADFEWGKDRGESFGRAMLAYPDWFIHDNPRPSGGRKTFSIWNYYRKNSDLQPAGLVGPVRLVIAPESEL